MCVFVMTPGSEDKMNVYVDVALYTLVILYTMFDRQVLECAEAYMW